MSGLTKRLPRLGPDSTLTGQGLVTRRARGHAGVLGSATLTALTVATLLVAATVLAPGIADSGFRGSIAAEPDEGRALRATTAFDADSWTTTDQAVRDAVSRARSEAPTLLSDLSATVWTSLFRPHDQATGPYVALGTIRDPRRSAELATGRWPRPGAVPLEVTVHAAAAEPLGITLGSQLAIDALVGGTTLTTTVVGTYRPYDADHPRWAGYGHGIRPGGEDQPATLGPVIVALPDLLTRVRPSSTTASWTIGLSLERLALTDADQAIGAARTLATQVAEAPTAGRGTQMVVTGESDLLQRSRAAATSVRAVLLVLVLMVTVLGAWALVFTARLVADRRAEATALLRARGASERTLLRWSARGWLLPAVAIAAGAPLLATVLLWPLEDPGLLPDSSAVLTSSTSWLVSITTAAAWLAILTAADLRLGQSVSGANIERSRPARRTVVQRAGLDLLAVALGLLGLQQLRRPPGAAPEIVLILAPSLVLLAGAVILVRLLPPLSHLAALLAARLRGIRAMLATFELARRPLRHQATTSLGLLALAVSVFAATTQATWMTLRDDTVDLAHPADVRVTIEAETADRARTIGEELLGLSGVTAATPVFRAASGQGGDQIEIVGFDSALVGTVIHWNRRLAGGAPTELVARLGPDEPTPALVTEGYADQLGLDAGETTTVTPGGSALRIRVAGVVDAVPGVTSARAVLVDQRALTSRTGMVPAEWWLSTSGDSRAVVTETLALPGVVSASGRAAAAERSHGDPTAAGLSAGLTAAAVAATLFLLIGVVVHAIASFRSRIAEHAVLRATGLSSGDVLGTVVVEYGILLGFSALTGLGLGITAAWLTVPHTVGGLAGLPDVPPLHLTLPWPVIAVLCIGVAAILTAVALAASAKLRRVDVPAVLRAGEGA